MEESTIGSGKANAAFLVHQQTALRDLFKSLPISQNCFFFFWCFTSSIYSYKMTQTGLTLITLLSSRHPGFSKIRLVAFFTVKHR
jgi:hypothetical protein